MRSQKYVGIIAISLFIGALSALAVMRDWLSDLEARTFDWRIRATASADLANQQIKIISIDQASLDHFADKEKISWPWPRSLYVPVLNFLSRGGAKVAAFDLLFTESGAQVGDDQQFVSSIPEDLPVVSAVVLRGEDVTPGSDDRDSCARLSAHSMSSEAIGPSASVFHNALLPIPELLTKSAAIASVNSQPDSDGIFRHTRLGAYCRDVPVSNLPLAMASLTRGVSLDRFKPLMDESGRLTIRFFGGAASYQSYSIHAIIASWLQIEAGETPHIDPKIFKDSYVLIGATAPGLLDLRAVPFPGAYSGVELNATILDNFLGGHFIRRVPTRFAAAGVFCACLLSALSVVSIRRWQLGAALTLLILWSGLALGVTYLGWWIPLVVPILAMGVVIGLGFFLQYQLEGKQHRFIKSAFQRYVTAEVIDRIVADPSQLSLGGERRELTMLFSDIAGFTSISERLAPADLVKFLNTFLSAMTDIILASQGTIDKYEGDAIIAFWNAPLTVPDHRERAVQAALGCQQKLRELASLFAKEFGIDIRMRIGINTGDVTVGNFGSNKRFDYTMIGDAANLAARLEGANKVFGSLILISGATRAGIEDNFVWRRVGDLQVKGKQEVVTVYEPLDPLVYQTTEADVFAERFEAALLAFERGELERATRAFSELSPDPVSEAYLARIQRIRNGGESATSVWILTDK